MGMTSSLMVSSLSSIAVKPAFLTASIISKALILFSSKSTLSFSVARLTLAPATPSRLETALSTPAAQEAQVIPLIVNVLFIDSPLCSVFFLWIFFIYILVLLVLFLWLFLCFLVRLLPIYRFFRYFFSGPFSLLLLILLMTPPPGGWPASYSILILPCCQLKNKKPRKN